MVDAISNFIEYLEDCILRSDDPEEIARLEYVKDKARIILEKVVDSAASQVSVSS